MPHVQVVVRCRPPLAAESHMPCTRIETNEIANTVTVSSIKNESAKSFAFDKVLPEGCSQEDVFEAISPLVDHAMDGLHATVFAYGQTGSGKTHTIEGLEYAPDSHGKLRPKLDTPHERHGILPRLIQAVFDRSRDRMGSNSNVQFRIKCSFMQLYNEKVSDLLNPSTRALKDGLKIRWTRDDHFEVENLYIFECESADQMREMMLMGVKEKVMSAHLMNQQSSRSHCIFTIHVHSWDTGNPDCLVKSELSVVDLAGSEKLALLSSNPSAQLLKESIEINTSLLSLGKVITALAVNSSGKSGSTHIPYRDSKLTKLLKHALGGNSMTSMIACIAPMDTYVEESLSTLLYAGRARNIKTVPKVNEDPRSALIRQLREEIASLKAELDYYKQMVGGGANAENPMALFDQKLQSKFLGGGHASTNAPTLDMNRPHSSDEAIQRATSGDDDLVVAGSGDLAEKLLAACKMLKSVVSVNNQLRTAFDRLKTARDESSQREVELNAENIALRERIEMLESIALGGDGDVAPPPPAASSATSSRSLPHSLPSSNPNPALNSGDDIISAYHRQGAHATRTAAAMPVATAAAPPTMSASTGSISTAARPTATDRLRDYANKYRNPAKPTRYEDYYSAAKKVVPTAASSALATQSVQELDRLLKNAPKATQLTVPVSLQSTQAFGSLAFGGSDEDTKELEERRRRRMEKLQQLQAQHDVMQRGFSGGVVPPMSTASASAAPPQPQASSLNFSSTAAPSLSFHQMVHPSSHGSTYSGNFNVASLDSRLGSSVPHVPAGSAVPPLEFRTSSSSSSTSAPSNAARLFNYLSQDEASKIFSIEQQDRLRQVRGLPSQSASQVPTGSSIAPSAAGRVGLSPRGQMLSSSHAALQQQLDQLQTQMKGRR